MLRGMATDEPIPQTDLRTIDDELLDAKGITSPEARAWLKGKRPEDFAVMEHKGRVYWPVMLQRRRKGADGKPTWTEEKALLRVLDVSDKADALRDAQAWFDAKDFSIKDPRHQAIWTEVEMHAQVAIALREALDGSGKPYAENVEPHPKAKLENLLHHGASGVSSSEVQRMYELIQTFDGWEGTKLERVDKELAIRIALTVAEVGNVSPLGVISGSGVDSCVVYWAKILSGFLRGERSGASPRSSTAEP